MNPLSPKGERSSHAHILVQFRLQSPTPVSSYTRLPQPLCLIVPAMAFRMPLIDIVHRTLLFGLVGMGIGGVFLGASVHRNVLHKGKGKLPRISLLYYLFIYSSTTNLTLSVQLK